MILTRLTMIMVLKSTLLPLKKWMKVLVAMVSTSQSSST